MDLQAVKDKLIEWVSELRWFQDCRKPELWLHDIDDESVSIALYTDTNRYRINIRLRNDKGLDPYMGAYVSTRKPRAGENHTRGNDLPDGTFGRELWHEILRNIVGYELVQIRPGPVLEKKNKEKKGGGLDTLRR